ncbi:FAD-dependent oxidoreductase [Streptomyces plumbiresistens]|uniref:ferredoxin--NADP(+) reductase n=1 Tax=Streptomyces plumbiresistens TaxID=511811 RepID=A0ABP7SKW0_9ACTN
MTGRPRRVAVIGAGPAGFFSCEALLKEGFEVDLYDALPTPFGLVRAGVAPDHPKIKVITHRYEKTATDPGFRFFGGVRLGAELSRAQLLERYHAVVYAVGTSSDNRLGIPGEDRPGSHPATEFVAWYNGHPEHADREFDLATKCAVVVGNGNVAIDVARMLVLGRDELRVTDTADHAVDALVASGVDHVIILGRRNPAQAAFTSPELLELGELPEVDVIVSPQEVALDEQSARWVEEHGDRNVRRNLEILTDYSQRPPQGRPHRIELRFLRSPLEVVGDGDGAPISGLRVRRNRIGWDEKDGPVAVPTTEEELIECGLVLRSIGYRGRPLGDLPFDESRGVIRNDGGRVVDEDGCAAQGEYVVGWIKRGPSGVIGTNKKDAADTVARLFEDAESGRLNQPSIQATGDEVEAWLRGHVPDLVTWDGWRRIDAHEVAAGQRHGRPRVKVVTVAEMTAIARRADGVEA